MSNVATCLAGASGSQRQHQDERNWPTAIMRAVRKVAVSKRGTTPTQRSAAPGEPARSSGTPGAHPQPGWRARASANPTRLTDEVPVIGMRKIPVVR